jgi:predicted ferric reductase
MGLVIKKSNYLVKLIPLAIVFMVVPIVLYFLGDTPKRDLLFESLSILTILGFSLLLSQFFLARTNSGLVKDIRMVNVLKIHKVIGYVFISILLLHPFFIVVPKLFDNGVSATDAFLKIITSFNSLGVILGIIAYCSMVLILITSFFRFKLHLNYKTWRYLHGYLTMLFIITATWHVINLGRHSNNPFSIYYLLAVVSGLYFLLKTYAFKTSKK